MDSLEYTTVDMSDNFDILTYEKPKDALLLLMEDTDPSNKKPPPPKRLALSMLD